jgi:hypothetical protein
MNDTKKQITVKIYDIEDSPEDPPENLKAHILWLQAKLEMIPEEFRSTALVIIDAGESYGCGIPAYHIEYSRLETVKEKESRENRERLKADDIKNKDLSTLRGLLKKYESELTK